MKRLKAILLLLTFSITLVGYSIEFHYCGNEITDISFLGASNCVCKTDASGCKSENHKSDTVCHKAENSENISCCKPNATHGTNGFQKEDCCKTEQVNVAVDDMTESLKVTKEQMVVLISLFNPYIFSETEAASTDFENYLPPLLYRDIPVMVQSFLI